jgi:hypothetical protein
VPKISRVISRPMDDPNDRSLRECPGRFSVEEQPAKLETGSFERVPFPDCRSKIHVRQPKRGHPPAVTRRHAQPGSAAPCGHRREATSALHQASRWFARLVSLVNDREGW